MEALISSTRYLMLCSYIIKYFMWQGKDKYKIQKNYV
nr:MAG TPA: hypothetical protein [Bacteriophage sp.]DAJ19976.1 MAG TPA: hypothetical protein [Myoviridae sp. ctiIS8]DAK50284.1 MAG TPA: hypothetical protein [Caudoviricetes sp.]DAK83050.1 MAG TPA: hypothetical protein [Caudoviricetes sp.]